MGIAIVSGILDSIKHPSFQQQCPNSSSSNSGTETPLPIAKLTHRMPTKFIACVKRDESGRNLKRIFNPDHVDVLCRQNVRGAKAADLVLLGAKPNMVKEILCEEGMREALAGKLLISIATGVTIAQMREWCPENTHIVRAMPNVPCKVGPPSLGVWWLMWVDPGRDDSAGDGTDDNGGGEIGGELDILADWTSHVFGGEAY
jgi:pyrroline-5-carboxylate reductase